MVYNPSERLNMYLEITCSPDCSDRLLTDLSISLSIYLSYPYIYPVNLSVYPCMLSGADQEPLRAIVYTDDCQQ